MRVPYTDMGLDADLRYRSRHGLMDYNWNWRIFFDASPEGNGTYLDMLLSGLMWTIATALCSWIIALFLGSLIGVLRTLPSKPANAIGTAYVELFRKLPFFTARLLPSRSHTTGKLALTPDQSDVGTSTLPVCTAEYRSRGRARSRGSRGRVRFYFEGLFHRTLYHSC